ncbi:GreA/GreB family elongation factor [uncultured Pseudomonas sp.]|uniref:GreA/GreB family elongation factor n=1 Tax=uncultured Pseudomonas sp. TaxID=114707 RepID=UPI00263241B1|nr:GreA/GreB family elongation factor [uncultured Pseudomonas sp.]
MTLHARKALLKNTRVCLIGPRDLTTLIGKLDRIERFRSSGKIAQVATVGSTLKLLDLEADSIAELTLVANSQSSHETHEVSIFSPLGSALLGAVSGEVISLQNFARGCRYLVLSVADSDARVD